MAKLKLGVITDDKPVKFTVELYADVHRNLLAYAEVLARETGQSVTEPTKLIAVYGDGSRRRPKRRWMFNANQASASGCRCIRASRRLPGIPKVRGVRGGRSDLAS